MARALRVVSYLNQFFAGLGGEEKANLPVEVRDGAIGSARGLQQQFGQKASIVATVVGGDNYVNEEKERALPAIKAALERFRPDVVAAGPAFNAGRYGLACAEVCKLAKDMGIPAVASMFPENPGVLTYKRELIITPSDESPSDMPKALASLARLALKLGAGEKLGPSDVDGYIPTGNRQPGLRPEPAYRRAVDMLVSKMNGRPFVTELPVELPEVVKPAAAVKDLASANIALVTSGGLVPKGNPDKLPGGPASVWFKYPLDGLRSMDSDRWYSVHVGFNTTIVNQNPNYVVPLNLMRELEDRGAIKSIFPWYLSTSGRGTPVGISKRIGAEMADVLREGHVDGALLVAT